MLGLITMAMIARHIGPEAFGIWNFSIALTTIAGGLAVLGLDKVVVKELVSLPEQQDTIISTALFMRLLAGGSSFVLCILIVALTKKHEFIYLLCTFITGLNIVLQSFDVFDYFYQAQNELQRVIIPKVTMFILFCVIKLVFITLNGSLLTFVWLSFVELLLTYLLIFIFYIRRYKTRFLSSVNLQEARRLIKYSWPLMFTGLLILLYMKSDQLMLDTFGNAVQLGEYAAAARISELWYAIPTVIATALLPGLIRKRDTDISQYHHAVEKWLRLSFWASLSIAVIMTFAGNQLISTLYGAQYPQSGFILTIHIWANIPVFICTVMMQYLIVEGAYKANLYATIAGIIVNVVINILLIPSMGGAGAAIATVASYMAVCITLIILDKSRKMFLFLPRMLDPLLALSDLRQLLDALRGFVTGLSTFFREKPLIK
jgi:O-antigen/teichoic acid export membrane protein